MNKNYLQIIEIMSKGARIQDLLALMEGDSDYSSDSRSNIPANRDELYKFRMALEHVRFVVKYGSSDRQVVVNGNVYSAFPEYFDEWIGIGAKGIEEDELAAYLARHPM